MSAKTVTAIARFLNPETRRAIDAVVNVDWHSDYASNIESRLHAIGEHQLAQQMLAEIDEHLQNA